MQCPSCNGFRPANNAPCPLCNAPSPLVNEAWNGQSASFNGSQSQASFAPNWGGSGVTQNSWGGSGVQQMGFPGSQGNFGGSGAFSASQPNFGGSGVQQMAFPQGQQPFAQPPDEGDMSFWSHNRAERDTRGSNQQQSLLPVPFQPQPGNGQEYSMLPTAFPTISPGIPQVNSLVPALPDTDQEAPVYVPPMYTKPRPIIPRYRAISGLISMLVVLSLLCGGSIYYAQVTGRLTFLGKLVGNYTPPSITTNQNTLNVPSSQVQWVDQKVITSVGISNREVNGQITILINKFTVGETIYLVCGANTANEKAPGAITIKWYTDNHFYRTDTSQDPIQPKQSVAAVFHIAYGLPSEGKAEVYWNDQLKATVLFVVEPSAA